MQAGLHGGALTDIAFQARLLNLLTYLFPGFGAGRVTQQTGDLDRHEIDIVRRKGPAVADQVVGRRALPFDDTSVSRALLGGAP